MFRYRRVPNSTGTVGAKALSITDTFPPSYEGQQEKQPIYL